MSLDQVASRYHTDPLTVLGWSPERVTLARQCLEARNKEINRIARLGKGQMIPTIFLTAGL